MSSIPYNYGSYIDAKVAMTDTGHVSAGKQIQSPASAGSRGLAKTTQFTNDRTQMQMGNSPMAESMIEIRNILNRIDGINVPVQEAPKDSDIDYAKLMLQISAMKDKIAELPIDDDRKTSALTALGQVEDDLAMDESAMQEDAGLTDEQKKGLEAIAKKYNDREGGNGRSLPMGHIQALTSSGITTDGYDLDEMEAYAKKIGKDWSEWEDKEINDFLKQAPITSGMIDDMIKVLGPDWEQNENLYNAAIDVLDTSVPFPEEDEMTFEDDDAFYEAFGELGFPEDENELFDAEYRGRKVPLNKPMRGDVKKFKVYVKDPKSGNVKKVNFGHGGSSARKAGQKTMKIRKSNPKARKSFRARHNCANPGPKTKARYWSCRKW